MLPALNEIGKFGTVVVDPPWDIGSALNFSSDNLRLPHPDNHYDVTPVDQMGAKFDVGSTLADDAHLLIWCTQSTFDAARSLLYEWGCQAEYSWFTWHKNTGLQPEHAPKVNQEFVWWGRKGKPGVITNKGLFRCVYAPSIQHSRKPSAFYHMWRRSFPGPHLDVFNRRIIDGWQGWGDESPYEWNGEAMSKHGKPEQGRLC